VSVNFDHRPFVRADFPAPALVFVVFATCFDFALADFFTAFRADFFGADFFAAAFLTDFLAPRGAAVFFATRRLRRGG
jgi:hypothetical protein